MNPAVLRIGVAVVGGVSLAYGIKRAFFTHKESATGVYYDILWKLEQLRHTHSPRACHTIQENSIASYPNRLERELCDARGNLKGLINLRKHLVAFHERYFPAHPPLE